MKQKILKLRESGYTYNQIIEKLGCSKSTISYHCRKNGLCRYDNSFKITDDLKEEIQKYYDDGHSLKESGIKYSINRHQLSKVLIVRKVEKMDTSDRKKSIVKGVIYWRQRVKIKLVEYKGGKCVICGYDKCIQSLEFHHIDPKEKDFTISGKTKAFDKMKKEIDKCMLVCSNCHSEIHCGMVDISKYQ